MLYLLLAGGYVPGIYICLFEMSEYELAWGSIIAVGPQEHVGKLELPCYLQELLTLVVLGAVHDDHRVLAPGGPLLIQPMSQGPEVELHHLGVGVCLSQGDVDVPQGIQAEDHGHSGLHLNLRD